MTTRVGAVRANAVTLPRTDLSRAVLLVVIQTLDNDTAADGVLVPRVAASAGVAEVTLATKELGPRRNPHVVLATAPFSQRGCR